MTPLVFSVHPANVRMHGGLPLGLWNLSRLFPYRSCPTASLLSLRVLLLAINGVTECFTFAAMSKEETGR